MSQKQRVTAYLQRIENDLASIANADNKELFIAVANNVAVTKNLCLQCLPEKNCSAYETLYDDIIRDLKEIVEVKNAKQGKRLFSRCLELIKRIINKTEREKKFKKDIVFLPYKASMWDSLESVWKAATADKDRCNAFVMPIPYAERNPDGSVALWRCERDEFPKYVPTLDWQAIDLKEWHPDIVVYHNPYDDVNTITSVEGRYYSRNLKECADMLIYIPYFVLEEPCSKEGVEHFATTPGVFNADKVIVQSEDIRQLYIDVLVEKSNQPSRKYWEEHILGLGSPKIDKVLTSTREDFELPEEWKKLTEGKKVVLYNTSIAATLTNADKVCDKLRYVFDVFRNRDDVVLWWRPHPLMKPTIHASCPQIEAEYLALEKEYVEEGFGIYDESPDVHRAICFSDAYYGDGSSVLDLYKYTNKPIMLQDYGTGHDISIKELRVWSKAYCVEENNLWFILGKTSILMKHDLKTGRTEFIGNIPHEKLIEESMVMDIQFYQGKLFMLPTWGKEIAIYDISKNSFQKIPVPNSDNIRGLFLGGVIRGNILYCIPFKYGKIVKFNMTTLEFEKFIDISDKIKVMGCPYLNSFTCTENGKILAIGVGKVALIFDLCDETVSLVNVDDECKYSMVAHIGKYVFFGGYQVQSILRIDCETREKKKFKLPIDATYVRDFDDKFLLADNNQNNNFALIDVDGQVIYKAEDAEKLKRNSWYYSYYDTLAGKYGDNVFVCDTALCKWYRVASGEFSEIEVKIPPDCDFGQQDWTNIKEPFQEFPIFSSLSMFLCALKKHIAKNENSLEYNGAGKKIMMMLG